MLGDPVNFAAYLAPESCSSLIGNEADFVNICDYIFYFCTSCYDDFLFELYSKTLYELLKNYSYRWKLRLKHIMTALKNLGFREDAMLCKKHFDDCLANRIEVIQQYCKAQGKAYKFALPSYPTFFKKRLERAPIETNDEETSPPSQEDRLKCVKNFISLVSNIVVTHSQLTEFKVSSGHDWTSQLILIHIFVLLSSDKLLNSDSFVKNNISLMLYQQFNSFSYKQWFGKEDPNSKGDKSKPKQNDFHSDEANASLDISEIISQVGQYDGVKNAFTWDRDSIAPLDHLGTMDHHHNMLQRVQLLPPTFRGNMIKKNAAYLQLQLLMDVGKETNPFKNI